jgi:hypothetical protein
MFGKLQLCRLHAPSGEIPDRRRADERCEVSKKALREMATSLASVSAVQSRAIFWWISASSGHVICAPIDVLLASACSRGRYAVGWQLHSFMGPQRAKVGTSV